MDRSAGRQGSTGLPVDAPDETIDHLRAMAGSTDGIIVAVVPQRLDSRYMARAPWYCVEAFLSIYNQLCLRVLDHDLTGRPLARYPSQEPEEVADLRFISEVGGRYLGGFHRQPTTGFMRRVLEGIRSGTGTTADEWNSIDDSVLSRQAGYPALDHWTEQYSHLRRMAPSALGMVVGVVPRELEAGMRGLEPLVCVEGRLQRDGDVIFQVVYANLTTRPGASPYSPEGPLPFEAIRGDGGRLVGAFQRHPSEAYIRQMLLRMVDGSGTTDVEWEA